MSKLIKAREQDILESVINTGTVVEEFLRSHCRELLAEKDTLRDIVEFCLSDIGFRLRAFLLRSSYEAGNRAFETVLPIAAGIELIQISTLVIDDVLDRSPMRNGRPSVFKQWGAELAISSGTLIGCFGFSLIAETLKTDRHLRNGLSVLNCLIDAYAEIYTGQFIDIECEADTGISEGKYFETIRRTTASFIGVPLAIGAIMWDAPEDVICILHEIGLKLGMAYQLRDDVIDIIGDPECTGKPKAMDILDRKMRLPVIHALANLDSTKRKRLQILWDDVNENAESKVEEMISLFDSAGSIQYSIENVKRFCLQADAKIDTLNARFPKLTTRLRAVSTLIAHFDED